MDNLDNNTAADNLLTQIENLTIDERRTFLDCPVCHESYRHPKTLDCGHTICARCLQGQYTTKKATSIIITCPICWEKTRMLDNDTSGLKSSSVVFGLSALLQKHDLIFEPRRQSFKRKGRTNFQYNMIRDVIQQLQARNVDNVNDNPADVNLNELFEQNAQRSSEEIACNDSGCEDSDGNIVNSTTYSNSE